MYGIDDEKEVKWSYVWSLNKKRANGERIKVKDKFYHLRNHTEDELKTFIKKTLKIVKKYKTIKYLFTVSKNQRANSLSFSRFHRMHLQEIMQRVQYEMQENDDLGVIFMDEVSTITDKMKKKLYHDLFHADRFVRNYKNLKDGLAIDISDYSFGVQVADYAAGSFSSFLRGYKWGGELFENYIYPKLRRSSEGKIIGYGVREVPSRQSFRRRLDVKLEDLEIV